MHEPKNGVSRVAKIGVGVAVLVALICGLGGDGGFGPFCSSRGFAGLQLPWGGRRAAAQPPPVQRFAVFGLIEDDYREGLIGRGERHFYKLAALRAPTKLPERYAWVLREGRPSFGCYTPIPLEAMRDLAVLDPRWRREVEALLAPPSDLAFATDTTSPWPIRVTYDDSGLSAAAQDVLDAAVTSYEMQVQQWGFWEPPIESGVTYFRYFLQATGMGGGGYTAPYAEVNATGHFDYYVYIVIDPQNPSSALEGVVAHEFNHACQAAMDGAEVIAFWENSATYIMSEVFASAWSYTPGYFPFYQEHPYRPLEYMNTTQSDLYEYGGAVWVHFLEHVYGNHDPVWLRQIWEGSVQNSSNNEPDYFDVIDDTLQSEGGFAEMVRLFGQYRFFTGSNDDGQHIDGAGGWPDSEVTRTATHGLADLPVTNGSPASSARPQPNGYNYVVLNVDAALNEAVQFSFAGQGSVDWTVDVLHVAPGQPTAAHAMSLDGQNSGTVSLPADQGDRLVMVVAHHGGVGYDPDTQNWSGADYTYGIERSVPDPIITAVDPGEVQRGTLGVLLTVQGSDFRDEPNMELTFSGDGITAGNPIFVSAEELQVQVNVAQTATLGVRDVTLTYGLQDVVGHDVLTVVEHAVVDGAVSDSTVQQPDAGLPADGGGGSGIKDVSGGCDCRTAGRAGSRAGAVSSRRSEIGWLGWVLFGLLGAAFLRRYG
jgi:hypothetical protein